MKQLLLFTFLFFILSSFTGDTYSTVYICTGKYSKKYHYTKGCRGLSNCKSSIEAIELSEAKKLGRTLCGWED